MRMKSNTAVIDLPPLIQMRTGKKCPKSSPEGRRLLSAFFSRPENVAAKNSCEDGGGLYRVRERDDGTLEGYCEYKTDFTTPATPLIPYVGNGVTNSIDPTRARPLPQRRVAQQMVENYIPANNFSEALGLLGQACKGVPVQFRLTPEEATSEESQWNHYVAAYRTCKTTQKCGANVSYDLFRPDPVAVMRCKAGIGTASEVACDGPDKPGCLKGITASAPLPDNPDGYVDKPDPDDSPFPVPKESTGGSIIGSLILLGLAGALVYTAYGIYKDVKEFDKKYPGGFKRDRRRRRRKR